MSFSARLQAKQTEEQQTGSDERASVGFFNFRSRRDGRQPEETLQNTINRERLGSGVREGGQRGVRWPVEDAASRNEKAALKLNAC